MLIYPESTQSNGKFIMPFKKGAFAGLKTVKPVVISYETQPWMSVAWECIGWVDHIVLTFSAPQLVKCSVLELPPFVPNDYLFETHKDKG